MCECVCVCSFESCDPVDCSSPGSSADGIPGKDTGVGGHFLQGIPDPGIEPISCSRRISDLCQSRSCGAMQPATGQATRWRESQPSHPIKSAGGQEKESNKKMS